MADQTLSKDRVSVARVIEGLAILSVAAGFTWIWNLLRGSELPWWAYLVTVAGALVIAVAVLPAWRKRATRAATALANAVSGLRLITAAGRASLEREGYSRRSAEVERERAVAKKPAWLIDAQDRLGTTGTYFLENSGYGVSDVSLTCDQELFKLEREAMWPGTFGNDQPGSFVARPFNGAPTQRGRAEGVQFRVSWHSADGDPDSIMVPLSSDDIAEGERAIQHEAFVRGVEQGRLNALAAQSPLPLPKPRWRLEADDHVHTDRWWLRNLVPGSVARNVRIEALFGAQISDAGFWPDLSATSGEAVGPFKAEVSEDGANFGTKFEITWLDETGAQHAQEISVDL